MATPSLGLKTCALNVNLFSGARTPLKAGAEALLTVRDGNQQTISLPNNGYVGSSNIRIDDLPYFNNFGDNYAVVASASGYQQAGFYP